MNILVQRNKRTERKKERKKENMEKTASRKRVGFYYLRESIFIAQLKFPQGQTACAPRWKSEGNTLHRKKKKKNQQLLRERTDKENKTEQ